uniref:BED-type domain-containing protein n=1 Tax=Panagrolaimus sp. JU765 TaxID=591449 RepID=A0AC34QHM0_9BILA
MATISANSFNFPGMNSNARSDLLEFLRDQSSTIQPFLFSNEFARLFLQQRYAQLAANQANRVETGSPLATMVSIDSIPAVKRAYTKCADDGNKSPEVEPEEKPRKRSRIGGQSVKTAEVWRFFEQIPNEQAANCMICSKTIKATNSSTTGMIRHLRSCHAAEHEVLQNARRQNYILKGLKRGVLDGEQLNEFALLQQMDQVKKEVQDSDTVSDIVESVAASTSSTVSDFDTKSVHTIERLIGSKTTSPKTVLEKCLSKEEEHLDVLPKISAKRGRPPKITADENLDQNQLQNKINAELVTLFTFGVLSVDVLDNPFFRNFLRSLAPDYIIHSAADFKAKIIPAYSNSSCSSQAFLKNNNISKTPTSRKSTRVSSEGKGPSPAPTIESGYHDEEEQHNDQSSANDSVFSDILNLCASTNATSEQISLSKSPSSLPEISSVDSDDEIKNSFEIMFQDLLDHVGHDIFPKENMQILLSRLYEIYDAIKNSPFLCKELGEEMQSLENVEFESFSVTKIGNDSGVELDSTASTCVAAPRLLKLILFGVSHINELNVLIKKKLLPLKEGFNLEDQELLVALHHHITNPES